MLANTEKVRREDQATQEAKKTRVKIMNEEIKIANVQALQSKEAARQTEKKLDADIAEFTRKKVAREEAKLCEDRRIKAEKELEIQRLREL